MMTPDKTPDAGPEATTPEATAWFDIIPQDWYATAAAEKDLAPEWPEESQWCTRHWAPCPVLGFNGISATTNIMQIWLREIAPKGSYSNAARNRHLKATGRICCKLGDERVYRLWMECPPAVASVSSSLVRG